MTNPSHLRIASGLLVAITLALSGCGGDNSSAAKSAEPRPTAAVGKPSRVLKTSDGFVLRMPAGCKPAPAELQGAWTYDLRPQDIPPEWADARTGKAERIFGPGYRFSSPVAGIGSPAHACVIGDVVHISQHPDCPGAGNEVLRWRVKGDELTLTPVASPCFLTKIHFGDPTHSRILKRRR